MSQPDAQRLCLSCGLCCSGAFFGKAGIETDEDIGQMIERGMPIQHSANKKRFFLRLPCTALQYGRCASYDCRPAVCHSYRCQLLKRVEQRGCILKEAQSSVAQAKELQSRLKQQIKMEFPELAKLTMLEACTSVLLRFTELEGPERIKFGRTHQVVFMAHAAYSSHIGEDFHRPGRDNNGPAEPALDQTTPEVK